ncbi:sulfatase-like hydrolase/transferase [Bacteroidales bacterium OttesenSCG-928-C03]|nr:sulfatase-like hydrolase/transferase [Bacteroidales bacterium OttesenSCG-928-E04]MDL2309134.1 sulfatase-like hydrolase/transferase [Bacteroidales bacterium OttesenSCG-928-C03]MDL2326395.1 sulfatase-like hydrolase/transferase [Bacteroidales bacterium OttesenSCG-928-A14]
MRKIILITAFYLLFIKNILAQERPNFIIVITDDQTNESIRALGYDEIYTPNMDRLVRNGMTFTHAFNQGSWSGAVSVASRTMLITGQNVINAQRNNDYIVKWARTTPDAESTKVKTIGETFSEAGYETFITGKWHNTDEPLLKGFQVGSAVGLGFYETYDEANSNEFAYNRPNDGGWQPWNDSLKGHWAPQVRDIYYENGERKISDYYTVEQHTSELYTDRAINYLQQEHKLPFFMYVAYNAPHDPRQSPREFVDMYPLDSIRIPVNYLPDHPFPIGVEGERDEHLAPYPRTPEAIRLHRQEYYAIISHFDRELGRLLDALENSPHKENTYIIFTSDHGLAVGMHGLMGKQNMYDHSMRIPFIITGPDVKAGTQSDALIYMQSIFATTCDLAGIPIPETVDYGSLKPILTGDQTKGEEYIFGYFRDRHRMLRSDRYKLILYPYSNNAQLFDLATDPYETTNLINNPDYTEIKEELFQRFLEKQKEIGDKVKVRKE